MPHLQHETFVTQIFWLDVFLFCFYIYIVIKFIPNISNIFKARTKLSASTDEALITSAGQDVVISKNLLTIAGQTPNAFKGKILAWTKSRSAGLKVVKGVKNSAESVKMVKVAAAPKKVSSSPKVSTTPKVAAQKKGKKNK